MSETPLADRDVEAGSADRPLEAGEFDGYLEELRGDVWEVVDDHHLEGSYDLADFRDALEFTCDLGELAEEAWHHPDLHLSWGETGVELWTHDVGGLTESDFVMAAKMDRIYEGYEPEE